MILMGKSGGESTGHTNSAEEFECNIGKANSSYLTLIFGDTKPAPSNLQQDVLTNGLQRDHF